MNRTFVIMAAFLFCILLLLLQFSCGAVKEKRGAGISPDADEKVQGELLLSEKHKAAGVECSSCHGKSDPASGAAKDQCLKCHGNYKEVASSYLDPHNAHYSSPDCGVCHHVHKPSEKICQGCHTFNLQAP